MGIAEQTPAIGQPVSGRRVGPRPRGVTGTSCWYSAPRLPQQHPTDTPLKTPPSVPSLTIAVGLASLLEARRDGSNLSLNTGCQNPRGAHCRGHQRMSQPPGDGSTASPPAGAVQNSVFSEKPHAWVKYLGQRSEKSRLLTAHLPAGWRVV